MKLANQALFLHLEDYCKRRDVEIASSGNTRWVRFAGIEDGELLEAERDFLQHLVVASTLRFGNHRSLSHLTKGDSSYIGLVGFDFEPNLPTQVTAIELNAGIIVCLLSEVKPFPTEGPLQIKNIIEASSREQDPDYRGHEGVEIARLFPRIQVFTWQEAPDDESIWRMYLMACIEECRQGGSWIDEALAEELLTLTDLNVPHLPYYAICRSVFDADPQSLFMALYRCIEATYAYESSRKLVEKLGLSVSWQEMAAALEDSMGWRPQESSSLNLILQYAVQKDLETVCDCLGVEVGNDLLASAGKAIYVLRNRIVHFRPGGRRVDVESIDWNLLCGCLTGIVLSVFSRAYS
ncbi:hypothetical protein GCM10010112_45710 [Actinoplanes lobatus]|uniref:Uncharacterized protein n=2 Tax=Actinoplanes lobatus TaxID=113568 RepID=A0A7W7HGE5_9ACTN|nr:hypothetical protein [Actinoplanes lobatus]MBB4750057.1 hypothetical protein [Actinoplanes lobatus]GGN74983.1 hypothetical protein GCM10010112_45710 [Actinoplanes lobatus]